MYVCIEQQWKELEVNGRINYFRKTGCEDVKWTEVAQDKIEHLASINTVMNLQFHRPRTS
jgi:hypothetical protein